MIAALASMPAATSADSFTPIRMHVTIAPVARLHKPLAVTVSVSADQGVLNNRSGPVRARVKLTKTECGGAFDHTVGTVLLDRPLSPQPDPSEPYRGSATGSGKPGIYGAQTVCVFIEDDYQQFASDTTDYQVDVSKPCTVAAARYDSAAQALKRARAQFRNARGAAARARLNRLIARRRATASANKRKARSACGPGVPL